MPEELIMLKQRFEALVEHLVILMNVITATEKEVADILLKQRFEALVEHLVILMNVITATKKEVADDDPLIGLKSTVLL